MNDPNRPSLKQAGSQEAAELIRAKISQLYVAEPEAKQEIAKEEALKAAQRSKHQAFMHELNHSGLSLVDIQTQWHNYYVNLPDNEKHEVWQEFYSTHARQQQQIVKPVEPAEASPEETPRPKTYIPKAQLQGTILELKNQLLNKVQNRSRVSSKQASHWHSLGFGLGMGAVVLFIAMFGFFNERFIAPFITPSRNVSATPIIIDPGISTVGPEAKIIIPKINLDIPVVYDEPSINDDAVQRALERGALHYPTTPNPGEQGNGVIFGHSSSNILNSGKYKFAFVLLRKLEPGDLFYVHKDGKRYVYKVFDKKVVSPTDISVLDPIPDKPATFTLITCDPPGSSLNRLVVIAEQISPDPLNNTASTAQPIAPTELPSNSPSLWSRITGWLSR